MSSFRKSFQKCRLRNLEEIDEYFSVLTQNVTIQGKKF